MSKLGVSSLVVVVVNTCAHSLGPGFKPLFGHYSESFFLHVTESPIFFFPSQFLLGTAFTTATAPALPLQHTTPLPPSHRAAPPTVPFLHCHLLAPPYSTPPPHAPLCIAPAPPSLRTLVCAYTPSHHHHPLAPPAVCAPIPPLPFPHAAVPPASSPPPCTT